MILFYIVVILSVIGVAAVFWLLKKEEASSGEPLRDFNPEETLPEAAPLAGGKPPASPLSGITSVFSQMMEKFNPAKKAALQEEPSADKEETASGTASITTSEPAGTVVEDLLSAEEKKQIETEMDLTAQLSALQEKYDQLDKLFKEKSQALEAAEESVQNELKNRKEFNKVKDLLEKELKDTKDKARNTQVELTSLEKNILAKDDEINNLVKRLQTFASPATAAVPPAAPPAQSPQPQESVPSQAPTEAQPAPQPSKPLQKEKKVIEIVEPNEQNPNKES